MVERPPSSKLFYSSAASDGDKRQGLDSERLSVGIAGVVGVVVTAIIALALFTLIKKRN